MNSTLSATDLRKRSKVTGEGASARWRACNLKTLRWASQRQTCRDRHSRRWCGSKIPDTLVAGTHTPCSQAQRSIIACVESKARDQSKRTRSGFTAREKATDTPSQFSKLIATTKTAKTLLFTAVLEVDCHDEDREITLVHHNFSPSNHRCMHDHDTNNFDPVNPVQVMVTDVDMRVHRRGSSTRHQLRSQFRIRAPVNKSSSLHSQIRSASI